MYNKDNWHKYLPYGQVLIKPFFDKAFPCPMPIGQFCNPCDVLGDKASYKYNTKQNNRI